MEISIVWGRPVALKDGKANNLLYWVDPNKLPEDAGVYVFGRRWGHESFEALYVGQATNIRHRVKIQFNNLKLMMHLRDARNGKRILLTGVIATKPGQQIKRCLNVAEQTFIRHFLSEGHDLVNKQGVRLRQDTITSSGNYPKRFFPRQMFKDK